MDNTKLNKTILQIKKWKPNDNYEKNGLKVKRERKIRNKKTRKNKTIRIIKKRRR